MDRRNALFGMAKWLMVGFAAIFVPRKVSADNLPNCREVIYGFSEIELAKELAAVLADAVYAKQVRYYTLEFRQLENTIVVRWGN